MMVREGKRKILGLLDGQVTPVVLPVNPGYISLKLSSISKVLTTLFKLLENFDSGWAVASALSTIQFQSPPTYPAGLLLESSCGTISAQNFSRLALDIASVPECR